MSRRKGILLAGGRGTRLDPLTRVVSKQLLPVYDKPMVHYPLSTLMLAGIREVLVVSTPRDLPLFRSLLGDGSQWGMHLEYAEQPRPEGIAQAFLIGRDFLGSSPSALILGDNIFFGHRLTDRLQEASERNEGATLFASRVRDPRRYGVLRFDDHGRAREVVEKPERPPSPWAVTGLYFYDAEVVEIAADLEPSDRGELEITDVNNAYLRRGRACIEKLGRGYAWMDMGTPHALLDAARFVEAVETRQDQRIACVEEVAFRMGLIDRDRLRELGEEAPDSAYGRYLLRVADGG